MKVRKILTLLLVVLNTIFAIPAFASDVTPPAKTEAKATNDGNQQLEARIMEIKNMDKSKLTAGERRALRKELKHMKTEHRHNGVYLSVGAIIIIILLLILLL